MTNAVKHSAATGVEMQAERSKGGLVVTVCDNGVGGAHAAARPADGTRVDQQNPGSGIERQVTLLVMPYAALGLALILADTSGRAGHSSRAVELGPAWSGDEWPFNGCLDATAGRTH